jgi:replicative DNA helicase
MNTTARTATDAASDAGRAIVATIITMGTIPPEAQKLAADDLIEQAHVVAWRLCLGLSDKNEQITPHALAMLAARRGLTSSLPDGGAAGWAEKLAADHAVVSAQVPQLVAIVTAQAQRRQIERAATEILASAQCGRPVDELRAALEIAAKEAQASAATTETAEPAIPPRICDDAVPVWSRPLPPALPTPFAPLNRLLGDGLSGLTTLVAPTGVGKTGLALLLGRHAAQSMPVLYVSTELGIRQSYARIAGQILRRPWYPLFRGAALTGQVVASATAGLDFRCLAFTSLTETLAVADGIVAHEGKAPFVILDFLQGAARDTTVDRRAAVSAACDAMLQWCRVDEGRVVLMISSTARAHYATDDRVARDLVGTAKESGDVEFAATAVLSLRTEECPLDGSTVGQIHVAKSRFGTVGIVGVVFEGAIGEFRCDERQSLSEIERAAYDAIAAGADTKDAVRAKLTGSSAAKTAAIRSLKMRGLISANPYRVIRVMDHTETESNDIEQRRTQGPDADPLSAQTAFTDGEGGSVPTRTHYRDSVRVRPPIGDGPDPRKSPVRGNGKPDEDLA